MREKKDINIEIGGNIQVAREQAGYTQDTLSEMLGMTDVYKRQTFFHSPTILIITDRTDLDDQLSKQFVASKKLSLIHI